MAALTKRIGRFTETGVDDEIIVMRLDNGEFFALSGTAAAAWRLIDGKRDRAALVAELATEFAADESRITADVDELLKRLKDSRLIDGD
jgi:pyrroloquinoline quinone biosynthesis protein D